MIETAVDMAVGQLGGVDAKSMAASQAISQQFATSEWLGPLAPVALSPFFGLTLLSGVATYGPDWLQDRSSLFSDGSALNNPTLFWIMLALAVLTSLPRFTKVSKPLALAAENLETYSAVIILFVVRFAGGGAETSPAAEVALASPAVCSAGLASLPLDLMMSLVAGLNVIVINAVKLFFEFLVWIVPFPTVDALLEAGNKSLCAALMALYCFSPAMATVVNLFLLAVCLLVFGWVYRRLVYYREIVAGPVLAMLLPGWFRQQGDSFRAFCLQKTDGLPSYAAVRVTKLADDHYQVHGRWLWRAARLDWTGCQVSHQSKLFVDVLTLHATDGTQLAFAHRKWVASDELAREPTLDKGGLAGA